MLEATVPIRTRHALIVDDLDIQDGVRVVDVGHLSGDLRDPVVELGEGQPLRCRREIAIVMGIAVDVEQHDGSVLARSLGRRGVAGVVGKALFAEDAGNIPAVGPHGFIAGGGQVTEAFD